MEKHDISQSDISLSHIDRINKIIPNGYKKSSESDEEVNIEFVLNCALEAGDMISAAINKKKTLKTKSCEVDFVTESDVAVEDMLRKRISEKFPKHCFLCEESSVEDQRIDENPTWIIDPIDGTTNFIHSFPFTCVSIAFARKKKVLIGVVYGPILGEVFWAELGGGSYLNNRRIYTSGCNELGSALCSMGLGVSKLRRFTTKQYKDEKEKHCLENFKKAHSYNLDILLHNCRDFRRLGSCALEICYIAAGRLDIFVEVGIKEWDIAAAILIAEEAGGKVTDLDGSSPVQLHVHRVLASSSHKLCLDLSNKLDKKMWNKNIEDHLL